MAKTRFRVEGLKPLRRELRELPKATATNVMKRAMIDAAQPLEADAEARAPVASGHLRRTIETGTRLSRRQKKRHRKQSKVEIFVGPAPVSQATQQEFGNIKHGPQPFLRPAWDGNKMRVLARFKDSLTQEIAKAAERAAARAARMIAKAKRS